MKRFLVRTTRLTMCISGCLVLGWIVYLNASDRDKQADVPAVKTRPLSVEFTSLRTHSFLERVEFTGTIVPAQDVTITARVAGKLASMPLHLGDAVKQRQLVAAFEEAPFRVSLARAESSVQTAQVQLRISRARLDFPDRHLEFVSRMKQKGYATSAIVNQSKTSLEIAKADVELAELRLQEAMSAKRQSQVVLGNAQVKAPFSGFVAQRFANAGDFVRSGDALLRLVDISTVIAVVHVVEEDYYKVQAGQAAAIRVDAFQDASFDGIVQRVAPVLDEQTRTAVVHLRIDNPTGRLKPGMHARIEVTVNRHADAAAVPITSLIERDGEPAVFVIAGQPPVAQRRTVTLGIGDDDYIEILSGVSAEDRIITLGSHLVTDGQEVQALRSDTLTKVFAAE